MVKLLGNINYRSLQMDPDPNNSLQGKITNAAYDVAVIVNHVCWRHYQLNSLDEGFKLLSSDVWRLRLLAIQIPETFIDSVIGFGTQANGL